MRLFLLLSVLLTCSLAGSASGQVHITPSGGSLSPGGCIFVDNWTDTAVSVEIKLDDGTTLEAGAIPSQSHRDYRIPKSNELLGRKVTITVTEANGTKHTETYKIRLRGAARIDAGGGPLARGLRRPIGA